MHMLISLLSYLNGVFSGATVYVGLGPLASNSAGGPGISDGGTYSSLAPADPTISCFIAIVLPLPYLGPVLMYVGGRFGDLRRRRSRRILRMMKHAKVRPTLRPIPIAAPVETLECEPPFEGLPDDEGDVVEDEDEGSFKVVVADVDGELDV
jgi:hypothetical protein